MGKLKKALALLLLAVLLALTLVGCTRVPKDAIEINVITSKATYHKETDETEVFLFMEALNGKKRGIESFTIDATIYYADGTVAEMPIVFDEGVGYARSSPLSYTLFIDGRVEEIAFGEIEIKTLSFWKTFGSFMLGILIVSVVVGIVFLFLAMAEMDNIISVALAAMAIINVCVYIFGNAVNGLIITGGILITLVPILVAKRINGY